MAARHRAGEWEGPKRQHGYFVWRREDDYDDGVMNVYAVATIDSHQSDEHSEGSDANWEVSVNGWTATRGFARTVKRAKTAAEAALHRVLEAARKGPLKGSVRF